MADKNFYLGRLVNAKTAKPITNPFYMTPQI